jgi:hypothetical protein
MVRTLTDQPTFTALVEITNTDMPSKRYLLICYKSLYVHDHSTVSLPHTIHCIDYVRQGLMCNADVYMKGNMTVPDGAGRVWGGTWVSRDFDAIGEGQGCAGFPTLRKVLRRGKGTRVVSRVWIDGNEGRESPKSRH